MKFSTPLQPGRLIRRYKRFLADIETQGGHIITVHCPNSGSMLGCDIPDLPVMISQSPNPTRKYPHTLEMVQVNGFWVGINTSRTNQLIREGLENGIITELAHFDTIRPEVSVGKSRLDFMTTLNDTATYIEVKNCTLANGTKALFPDAVTARGTKHLLELQRLRAEGNGAALIFCVQRGDVDRFAPAGHIDPLYARTLDQCRLSGVMILAYRAEVCPAGIVVTCRLPVSTS
ncbi:MAG: DNA/RNA nuclease SfsA [Proteobacteria bacterium]|nr:DNA/RNA nuclease SfsA [Pseudomonadota bacterium]MBU1687490.1 DNA/RNA nuclease SfsA [Pseudomonadota bacterium]